VGETTQFIAIGNLSGGGPAQDLTNKVRWVSSDVGVATIDQAGLATSVGALGDISTSTITAIATTSSGSVITATGTQSMVPGGTVNLPTLTLYKVGLGDGTITSSPAGLTCGPHATCTGNFQLGATVTLTATPAAGSSFAGWSANCTSSGTSCTIIMGNNDTVGAIFNVP